MSPCLMRRAVDEHGLIVLGEADLRDAAWAAHDAGIALTLRGRSPQRSWLDQTFPCP